MKITCQACQAKYTIADEKVVGKVVKIRCKKCGATIVVNGAETVGLLPSTQGAADHPSSRDEAWTANVGEGDQRTMTSSEMVVAYRAGVVTDDTFCWKEGMPDWLPIGELTELHAACSAPVSEAPSRVGREEDEPPTRIQEKSGAEETAQAPEPGAATRSPGPKPAHGAINGYGPSTVAARRPGTRSPAADLFGDAAHAGGENEVMTSAPLSVPQPHADAQKLTGARNENSVLFALNPLADPGGNGPAPGKMQATNEASGLIDIRQLSAQMRSTSADDKKKSSRVDDIMNLGGGGFSASLAAPVLSAPSLAHISSPPPADMSDGPPAKSRPFILMMLAATAFFFVAAVSLAILVLRGKGPAVADDQERLGRPTVSETAPSVTASSAPAASAADTRQTPPAEPREALAGAATRTAGAAGSASSATAKETPPKEPSRDATPREPKLAPVAAAPKETTAVASSSAEFNMGEAKARLAAIAGGVQSCKRGDTTGTGRTEIVFSPGGSVQSASVMAGSPFDGTPTAKCVEARFRGARVPAFSGGPFTVTKSFRIN